MQQAKSGFLVLLFFFSFCCYQAHAQDTTKHEKKNWFKVFTNPQLFYATFLPQNIKPKKQASDTNYIRTYPRLLNVAAHLFVPIITLNIDPLKDSASSSDVSSQFTTNVSSLLGFNVNYRMVSAGFAIALSNKNNPDYAHSSYRTATIRYNGEKYYLQFRFMRAQGFTDLNQANSTDPTQPYRKREDMVTREYQFEGMYNFSWKKYSFYAPLAFSQRQLKSRAGLLLKTGFYYNQLSGDSDLVSKRQQPYFGDFSNVQTLKGYTVKVAPGIGGNLILFRRFYLSAAVFTACDLYFYQYLKFDQSSSPEKGTSLMLVLDGKICMGYQSDRFYAGLRYEGDTRAGSMKSIRTTTLTSYFGFDIGYRFNTPKIVRKVYKATMPPGL